MTSSTFSGWMGCVAAGVGSLFFLTATPDDAKTRSVRPVSLHAAVGPSDTDERLTTSSDQTTTAKETLQQKVELLERGHDFLMNKPGYTARFHKQEAVQDELLDAQTIQMKCRHEPFSVYLTWETGDVGREVLYVDGENNGKMLAHDGGWKSRLPAMSFKPDCSLAMRDARYPVTDAGLIGLVNIMLDTHKRDLEQSTFASCTLQKRKGPNGRPCAEFTTRYITAAASPTYRKSITLIDDEWSVPLETHHFTWPKDGVKDSEDAVDAATLIESYRFDDINFAFHPKAEDFDRSNAEYHF